MSRILFMLEERSMREMLEALLPRVAPGLDFLCLVHQGKSDLEKSLPRKLRAWRDEQVRFVVVRDADNEACLRLKARLKKACAEAGRPDTIVRLPCQELEAWYLGDPAALRVAYPRASLRQLANAPRFRNVDAIEKPSRLLAQLVPEFQKLSGGRQMGRLLGQNPNRSRSFQVFLETIRQLAAG